MLAFSRLLGGHAAMPAKPPDRTGDGVRAVVRDRIGHDDSAEHAAEVARSIVAALWDRLSPLVGESGVAALLDHAIEEHRVDGDAGPGDPWRRVEERVRRSGRPPDTAADLVVTFVLTISAFIGETLTARVLHDLWPDVFGGEP